MLSFNIELLYMLFPLPGMLYSLPNVYMMVWITNDHIMCITEADIMNTSCVSNLHDLMDSGTVTGGEKGPVHSNT